MSSSITVEHVTYYVIKYDPITFKTDFDFLLLSETDLFLLPRLWVQLNNVSLICK